MSFAMGFAASLAAVLVLVPLPGHWRARNIPMLSMIAWLFIINVSYGINAIAWYHSIDRKLLTYCDITIRLDIGSNVALPAACFCLSMHLERVASIRQANITLSDKKRRMLVDIGICVGIPVLIMALFYIVQGHRFDIVEDFGCRPETYVSWPEFLVIWLLPILFCLGTFILSGMSFFHFYRRRASFAKHLANSNSKLTPSRYFRLMTMSLVEMFWAIIVISLTLSFNYRYGLRPWTNWADVHSNFGNINRFPTLLISPSDLRWTYFLWWSLPISAYIFFGFFGFSQEVLREYGACFEWFRRSVLRQKPEPKPAQSFGSLGYMSPAGVTSWPRAPAYSHRTIDSSPESKLEEALPKAAARQNDLTLAETEQTSATKLSGFETGRLGTGEEPSGEDILPTYSVTVGVPSSAMAVTEFRSAILTAEGRQFLLSRDKPGDLTSTLSSP